MKQKKSSRDWTFRINDILHAIDKIEQFTHDLTFTEFRKNELVVDAVIRNFEIIGEASSKVPLAVQRANPQIPWKQVIGMRNFLIHEYFGVDVNTVWQTIHTHLPVLKQQLLMIS
ncbi:MAG: DUF86 domain-containing protein [Parachlamydia sp.]|nr:DUF86 domain-containing protein [Parachlamydia sp.]